MSYAKVSVWLQALWIGPIEVGLPLIKRRSFVQGGKHMLDKHGLSLAKEAAIYQLIPYFGCESGPVERAWTTLMNGICILYSPSETRYMGGFYPSTAVGPETTILSQRLR